MHSDLFIVEREPESLLAYLSTAANVLSYFAEDPNVAQWNNDLLALGIRPINSFPRADAPQEVPLAEKSIAPAAVISLGDQTAWRGPAGRDPAHVVPAVVLSSCRSVV